MMFINYVISLFSLLIREIFSPNVVYSSYIKTLHQSLGLEPASASLKLTYIFWRGQSSKSIPYSWLNKHNRSLLMKVTGSEMNNFLCSLFQFSITFPGRDGRDGRKGSVGARGMPGSKGIHYYIFI